MIKKLATVVLIFLFLFSNTLDLNAREVRYIEIFDPTQNKVVKVVEPTAEIQNIITGWITHIQGIYGKNDPVTDDGYALRVPLNPSVSVHNKWVNAIINEIYIIIPETEPPFFIIFEAENKLCCYPFNGDIDQLSSMLNFKLYKK
ncbi:hypothetical protein [Clostridium oryzae]|uniref:Uncharacterized protein n=1 Tax=Clostridium oryzae TaxID=1450648 RepID=A0A1V4IF78_9CLOT|nr:hypothetical protein [Clostridium oryzae]OPJ58177.1 hypothetical protein CLORY_37410 [Clostridium oryzae]